MTKLLILTDWFSPAYKSGGPITSLSNLVQSLEGKLNVTVITSAYDLGEKKILDNIVPDKWQVINNVRIKYLNDVSKVSEEMLNEQYDCIYLNSMFSPDFTIRPLLRARSKGLLNNVILSPRGMLQKGALQQKPLKKKLFLILFRLSGIGNKIQFHATDEQEKEDILKQFPKAKNFSVIPNIVKKPLLIENHKIKKRERLKLVYLSIISSKKNIHYLIDLFNDIKANISLDVYGSVKDYDYWASFSKQIIQLSKVDFNYKGDIPNHRVIETLSKYDFFILPTLGENFGHAIYEAMSAGTPVIISDKTPWRNLEQHKAGWDIPLSDKNKFIEVLNKCALMDQSEYEVWSNGAFNYVKKYYEENDPTQSYTALFNAR